MIFASNNKDKIIQIKDILEGEIFSLKDKGIVIDVDEDAETCEDNAIKKAVENGRDKVTITGQIPACIILELQENGFRTNNGLIEW